MLRASFFILRHAVICFRLFVSVWYKTTFNVPLPILYLFRTWLSEFSAAIFFIFHDDLLNRQFLSGDNLMIVTFFFSFNLRVVVCLSRSTATVKGILYPSIKNTLLLKIIYSVS